MLVALLALFVALGGVGYAAIKLPRNSVGTKQLKRNAVTSAKVRDATLRAKDFGRGQLPAGPKGDKGDRGDTGPPGPTFGAAAMGSPVEPAGDPVATPEETSSGATSDGRHFEVTLPSAGDMFVRFFVSQWGVGCSVGGARAGLYLDGAPVPGTARPLSDENTPLPAEIVAIVATSAGLHSLEVRADCPGVAFIASAISNPVPDWTALLLGS